MIAFFIHLHMVKMRDDKNVMKITNNKKNISSTENCSYHLDKLLKSYLWIYSRVLESWRNSSRVV